MLTTSTTLDSMMVVSPARMLATSTNDASARGTVTFMEEFEPLMSNYFGIAGGGYTNIESRQLIVPEGYTTWAACRKPERA
jgi:hypothetical protein